MDRRRFLGSSAAWFGAAGLGGAATLPADVLTRTVPSRARQDASPIRLMYNENALGLSERAWEAVIAARSHANLYPEEMDGRLRQLLADRHGVSTDHIVLGHGSTEILQTVVQAATGPGVPLIIADPTYEDVVAYQRALSFELLRVPLDGEDRSHDLGRMRELAEASGRPAVVYLCNPNNPTGTITSCAAIDRWIREAPATTLFLVDEAYFEYADDPDYWSMDKFVDRPNVIVARTFSKIYAMAGMRLGYAVAHEDTVRRINDFSLVVGVNQFALAAGIASMEDTELIPRSVAVNAESKRITQDTLNELGLQYLPTQGNFIMHRISGDVRAYIDRMREAGIRVGRPFPPMLEWNRLSFGLPAHMERWAETIRDFRRKGWV